jgi:radical SAM superfamily enzyme YgiQ (UPF0313 family)|tara:strand:+ start:30 stop:1520 length:1491 start_codon:yes stop_codon:yes gene_type:complete
MKILFVFSNYAPVGGGGIPIGLSILINIAKQKGHDVKLFDTSYKIRTETYQQQTNFVKTKEHYNYNAEREYLENELVRVFRDEVNKFCPKLICFSTLTPTHELALSLLNGLDKSKDQLVIFGGIHSTVIPEEVIMHEKVDIVCVGEGEKAFSSLLVHLSGEKDYYGINNLWCKKNGEIVKNSIDNFLEPDLIPYSDCDLFDERHLYRSFKGKNMRSLRVEISRGCVYKCSYCTNKNIQNMSKGKIPYFRYKSVDRCIEEFLFYKNILNLEMFYFKDEVFLMLPKKWLREFAKEYKAQINLPFFCQSSAKDINEENVKILKDMGCVAVAMGVEVGNEEFRKKVLNKPVSNAEIVSAVKLLRKNGIRITTYFMIGLPYETRELIFDTIEFQRVLYSIGSSPTHINSFYPFPGCDMEVIAKKEGFINKNFEHNRSTTNAGLDMPQLSAVEIEGLLRTYAAYTRVDKWMYPIIELCEAGDRTGVQILNIINEYYSERADQ